MLLAASALVAVGLVGGGFLLTGGDGDPVARLGGAEAADGKPKGDRRRCAKDKPTPRLKCERRRAESNASSVPSAPVGGGG
ncbi:MAG: hypothetical protein ABR529_12635 [Actinomycetota bacterium]